MSGLYTKYGNPVTNFSTSYQRTVFGNGLVNGTAAGSMIGSATLPTGDNYYGGVVDLGKNKLNLPSWLVLALRQTY